MKMLRKPLTVAAAAALAVTGLSACSPQSSESQEKVMELNLATSETPWLGSYKKIVADYEAETGVKVNLTTFPFEGLLSQQANAAQNGSNAFDLFQLNEQWVGQFYDNGWVQPLTDVNPDFKWDENLIDFDGVGRWDAEKRTTSPDGVPYALPINGNIHLFTYREDLYDQLGLDVPKTWDDVVKNSEEGKASGAAPNGYVLRGKTPTYDWSALLFSYGGSWFKDEQGGDWTPNLESPEARKALEEFKRLAEAGPAAPQTIAQAEATSLMQGGSVLNATFVAAVAAALENPAASQVAGKIGYAPLPGSTPVSGTWTLGIPTGLPENRSEAAYDFLNWLTGKEAMQKWAEYGGVTTRTDISTERPELKAIIDSAEDIRGGLRYPFTPKILEATDPLIGQYLAGSITVKETMSRMQESVKKAAEEAGYLK